MRAIFLILLCLCFMTAIVCEEMCKCVNGGKCSNLNSCECPIEFIGQKCQIYAQKLSKQAKNATLTSNFTYFYFQPTEENYYRLTFNICMIQNPNIMPSIFYIQTQKGNGSLRFAHSLYEVAKLVLGEKGCTSFSTHYISIKRRENQGYRKIVIGLKALQKEDDSHYLNVYRSEPQGKDAKNTQNMPKVPSSSPLEQIITVQLKAEKYKQNSYYGSFIIVSTASLLIIIFAAFVNFFRKRYRVQLQDRLRQFQQFDSSRLRYYNYSNPQQLQRRKRRKLQCIQTFMPVTKYGQKSSYFVTGSLNSFQQMLQTEEQVDCCSICLINFQKEDEIRTTPCKHQYHRECIDNWCGSKPSCPICRRALDFKKQMRRIYLQFLRREIVR